MQKIQSRLIQETSAKIILVSDHGASRLAVIYGQELNSTIALDDAGEHSGRCCPAENNPQISVAAYENGFSILANYERFKGGRRANVEVHGGASLEGTAPEITIYSNIPIQEPRLGVNGEFYIGELGADNRHAKFKLTKIKRKGKYFATVYYGNKKISKPLEFKVERQTGDNPDFNL